MPSKPTPQLGMDEVVVESAEAEGALEVRLKLRNTAAEARRQFQVADETAKGLILPLIPDDADAVRLGRFRITRTVSKPGHRAFDVAGGKVRLSIEADDDNE